MKIKIFLFGILIIVISYGSFWLGNFHGHRQIHLNQIFARGYIAALDLSTPGNLTRDKLIKDLNKDVTDAIIEYGKYLSDEYTYIDWPADLMESNIVFANRAIVFHLDKMLLSGKTINEIISPREIQFEDSSFEEEFRRKERYAILAFKQYLKDNPDSYNKQRQQGPTGGTR